MRETALFVRVTRGQTGLFLYRLYTYALTNTYTYTRVCLGDQIEII